jgi:molybdopterin synthase sulfur carrier subunit
MPKIELRLFGHLRDYLPERGDPGVWISVPDGFTLDDLIKHLKIPPSDPKIVLVNGLHAERDKELAEGDRVSIFPPIAGG